MNYSDFISKNISELNDIKQNCTPIPTGGDVLEQAFASPILQRTGTWVEFGVFNGLSLQRIVSQKGDAQVYGFDTFEGLPEDWVVDNKIRLPKGTFATKNIPNIIGAHIIAGLFQNTLHNWQPNEPITFVHIDCDIYSATSCVLTHILPMLGNDTIIVFDELFNYSGFEDHEMKALYEAHELGLRYDWLFVHGDKSSSINEQAALKVNKSK